MSFKNIANQLENPQGTFNRSYPYAVFITPRDQGTAIAGEFGKVNADGDLIQADGTDTMGIVLQSNTNLGVDLANNPLQEVLVRGYGVVIAEAGFTPNFGDYVKCNATGEAVAGTEADNLGRYYGHNGEPTTEATPRKTIFILLKG